MPGPINHLPLPPETTAGETPALIASTPCTADADREAVFSRTMLVATSNAVVGAWYGMLAGLPTGLVLGAISAVFYLFIPFAIQAARSVLFGLPGSDWTGVADLLRALLLVAFVGALYGAIPGTLIGGAVGVVAALAQDERAGAIGGALLGAVLGPLFMWGDTTKMLLAVFAGAVGGFLVARMTAARSDL